MTFLAWLIFVVAALLEVGGDAVIRRGLRVAAYFSFSRALSSSVPTALSSIPWSGISQSYLAFMSPFSL